MDITVTIPAEEFADKLYEAEALSKILQGYVRNEQKEVNNSNETK